MIAPIPTLSQIHSVAWVGLIGCHLSFLLCTLIGCVGLNEGGPISCEKQCLIIAHRHQQLTIKPFARSSIPSAGLRELHLPALNLLLTVLKLAQSSFLLFYFHPFPLHFHEQQEALFVLFSLPRPTPLLHSCNKRGREPETLARLHSKQKTLPSFPTLLSSLASHDRSFVLLSRRKEDGFRGGG